MRGHRVGVHVEQRRPRCVSAEAGDDRHVAARTSSTSSDGPAAVGLADEAEIDERPSTARCGSAARRADAGVRAGRPTAASRPRHSSAATKRVFTAPASTATTTSSVAASVMRRPSTCRFAMPARAERRVDLAAAAMHDDQRRRAVTRAMTVGNGAKSRRRSRAARRRASGRAASFTAAPSARRSRTRR